MTEMPEVLKTIRPEQLVKLDVRPVLAGGTDPFQLIMEKVKSLEDGQVLEVINTFTPAPLITVLKHQGFSAYAEMINEHLVQTYFFRDGISPQPETTENDAVRFHWEEIMTRFKDNLVIADVRSLEMPQPMIAILKALETLPERMALFVYHKKLPVFLLPELAEKKFDYRVREIQPGEVHLLIFRP
jgi:TusA-related sulfurtransferase